MSTHLTEEEMIRLWELHTDLEFSTRDPEATVATMSPGNYVNHVPVMTGGRGPAEMIDFYGKHFIPKMPADTALRLLARTVGRDRLVDEFVFSFTHDIEMDWMLPGVKPASSCRSACSIQKNCRLPVSKPPARSSMNPCRPTP